MGALSSSATTLAVLAALAAACSSPAPVFQTTDILLPDPPPTTPPPPPPDSGAPSDSGPPSEASTPYSGACPGPLSSTNLGSCFANAQDVVAKFDPAADSVALECVAGDGGPVTALMQVDVFSGKGEYYNFTFTSGTYGGLCHVIVTSSPKAPIVGDEIKGSFSCPCVEHGTSMTYATASGTFDLKFTP